MKPKTKRQADIFSRTCVMANIGFFFGLVAGILIYTREGASMFEQISAIILVPLSIALFVILYRFWCNGSLLFGRKEYEALDGEGL